MPEPRTVVPVPSKASRAPESFRLIEAVPAIVCAPPVVTTLSSVTTPPLAMLTLPLIVSPLITRSMELPLVLRSSVPLKVAPLRKLEPLLVPRTLPVPTVLTRPSIVTPFCTTVLPAWARICPWLMTLVFSARVAPLIACTVLVVVRLPEPPGAKRVRVPPATSEDTSPLMVTLLVPPLNSGCPTLPWPWMVMPEPRTVVPVPSKASRAPGSFRLIEAVPAIACAPPGVFTLSRVTAPPLAMFTLPLIVSPLITRSTELPFVLTSSVPVKFAALRKLSELLVVRKAPPPLEMKVPLTVTPFCTTVLPAWERICPWLLTLVFSARVAPLIACTVLVVVRLPEPPGATRLSVPPATSADTSPLIVTLLVPPLYSACPTVPWPRMVMPEPSTVVPVPSKASRAAASFRLTTAVPETVCVEALVLTLSSVTAPPLAMLTAPLIVSPLITRSTELPFVLTSSVPVKFEALRKLSELLVARKAPPPLETKVPLTVTPFCTTVLPAPDSSRPVDEFRTLVSSARMPPLTAWKVPLLVMLPEPPGATIDSVPPAASADTSPLMVTLLVPPLNSACPTVPWPWMVMPEPSTVVPLPSKASRAFAEFRLIEAVPLTACAVPVVFAPSRVTAPPLAMLTLPLIVTPLITRSMALPSVLTSSVPVKFAALRKLLPLLVVSRVPVPTVLSTPLSVTPFCWTVLPFWAMIWPLLRTLAFSARMPPPVACSVPLLVTLPDPPGAVRDSVPPDTSAEIRPLKVTALVPPLNTGLPMLPWPWMVMPAAKVVAPLPSKPSRAPASLRLIDPVPATA